MHILDETQIYAERVRPGQFKSEAAREKFKRSFASPTFADLENLICIFFIAGLVQTSTWAALWTGPLANPFVMQLMTFEHFRQLLGILHFGHNLGTLGRIEPLLGRLRQNFRNFWLLGKWLCVDEGMIPFQGMFCHSLVRSHWPREVQVSHAHSWKA